MEPGTWADVRTTWIERARTLWEDPGSLEIDENADVLETEGAAWVRAWVRVPR